MKKLFLTFALVAATIFAVSAQETCSSDASETTYSKWYIGTGNIDGTAWTDLSILPSIGYKVAEDVLVAVGLSQEDSGIMLDLNVRYFFDDFYAYAGTTDAFDNDSGREFNVGIGKFFDLHRNIYVDPQILYNTGDQTTNLTLGFGLRF